MLDNGIVFAALLLRNYCMSVLLQLFATMYQNWSKWVNSMTQQNSELWLVVLLVFVDLNHAAHSVQCRNGIRQCVAATSMRHYSKKTQTIAAQSEEISADSRSKYQHERY